MTRGSWLGKPGASGAPGWRSSRWDLPSTHTSPMKACTCGEEMGWDGEVTGEGARENGVDTRCRRKAAREKHSIVSKQMQGTALPRQSVAAELLVEYEGRLG